MDITQLLNDLNYYKYVEYDETKIEAIEAQLLDIKKQYALKKYQTKSKGYIAYPDYDDPEFFNKIFLKKEFNKTIEQPIKTTQTYDEIVSSKCSSNTEFKLTNNQIFLKTFFSPSTPYNSILLFHGVGVGKCFAKNTRIMMIDGSTKHVQDVKLDDVLIGDDCLPRIVKSLSSGYGKMYTVSQMNGYSYTVNNNHILSLYSIETKQIVDISIQNYLKLKPHEQSTLYGYKSPLTFFNSSFSLLPHQRISILTSYINENGFIQDKQLCIKKNNHIVNLALSVGIGIKEHKHCGYTVLFGTHLNVLKINAHLKKQISLSLLNEQAHIYPISVTFDKYDYYYGFSVDKNHRFLLGDYTVTHNSCSAISIAEQYFDIFDKKVLVLTPSNLKENFKKQIFDIDKIGCTGNKYRQMINIANNRLISKELLEKRINRVINDKYSLLGFQEFANQINKIKENFSEAKFQAKIRERFSNRVIIIDEAHNIREGDEGYEKIISPVLMKLFQNTDNVKLILLTATPMFNEATEIIWLINLMLANDKRPLLNNSDIFDSSGKMLTNGELILSEAIKGYVSYMKGENPYTFPFRLYPSINKDKNIQTVPPHKDIKGNTINKNEILNKLELIESKLSSQQTSVLKSFTVDDDYITNTQLLQISNIIYPNNLYGLNGFKYAFEKKGKQYAYKDNVDEFLSPANIGSYSPKIKTILDYIKKSTGIVFVYSYYIDSGIIPLALALEHIGFKRYKQPNLLSNTSNNPKPFLINGKQARYSILSAKKELTNDFNHEIDNIKSIENKDGEVIKVVLGTSVAGEGLDLKCIREIHMLEPWYHLNKVEQLIGRAVRNCSHIYLPSEKRNVTIYHHISTTGSGSNRNESIDERVYRIAEFKQTTIDRVEDILKSNALDCHFNHGNTKDFNDKLKQVTSQGTVTYYTHKDTTHKCAYDVARDHTIDSSTFSDLFYDEEIKALAETIALLFTKKHYYYYEEIKKALKKSATEEILIYTLEYMLNTKYVVSYNNVLGHIIYRSNIYIFQPNGTIDTFIPLSRRDGYKPTTVKQLCIDSSLENKSVNKTKNIDFIETNIRELHLKFPNIKLNYIYDYVIDRLDFNSILEIATPSPNPNQSIQKSLISGHYMINIDNSVWVRDIINDTFYVFNEQDKTFNKASSYLYDKNSDAISKKIPTLVKDFIGYLHINKKNNAINFKLIDAAKPKSNGFVCANTSTLKIDTLKNKIETIEKCNTNMKKPELCDLYELMLRQSKKFARPYDAIVALKL